MGHNVLQSPIVKQQSSFELFFQYIFLYECFERIQEEKQWRHKIMSERGTSVNTATGNGGDSADK